jgi:hypothetical protein
MKTLSSLALICILSLGAALAHAADETPVTAGTGKVKFNGLLQFWTLNDTTIAPANFNFRIRRTELKFSGSVADNTRWFVMVDPSKALNLTVAGLPDATKDNKIVQDVGVAWSLTPELEVIGGQFKTLTTAEGLDSSSELLFPERAYVSRAFGDARDQGMQINYKTSMIKVGAMVSQGMTRSSTAFTTKPTANLDDSNADKDLSLRVDVTPIEGVKLGAFTYANEFSYGAHGRFGANARYEANGIIARLEAVLANDYELQTKGWNLDGGYTFGEFQPVVRWEGLSNDTLTGNAFWLGVNYLLAKNNAKVQLAGGALTNMNGANGSYAVSANKSGSVLILSFQAAI